VEGQMLRDCLIMMNVARNKYRNLIVVCPDPAPERMLNALGLEREADPSRTNDWISYRTQDKWPQEPPGARNIIQRDLYVPKPSGPQMQVLDNANGYYLPPKPLGRAMATLH
jgi:hypothetical protein